MLRAPVLPFISVFNHTLHSCSSDCKLLSLYAVKPDDLFLRLCDENEPLLPQQGSTQAAAKRRNKVQKETLIWDSLERSLFRR